MTDVAITGAAGNVGRAVLDGFDDHDVTAYTHREHDDLDSEVLDVTERDAFVDAMAGHDVLVHLAANPSPYADWDDLSEVNVEGVYNAFHAAREAGLDRVLEASSNHALNGWLTLDPEEPETMAEDAPALYPDDPTMPDSAYGASKAAGEAIGDLFAHRHGLEVVHLRIGWLMTREELRETVRDPDNPHPEAARRYARAMWLSPPDCRRFVEAAATAEIPAGENPVNAHGVSRNDERRLSLAETGRVLGYHPRDDAAEVLADADEA